MWIEENQAVLLTEEEEPEEENCDWFDDDEDDPDSDDDYLKIAWVLPAYHHAWVPLCLLTAHCPPPIQTLFPLPITAANNPPM